MKNRLVAMSCEERKKAKEKYFATKEGKYLKPRLDRLMIYSILLIAFSIYVIYDSIKNNDTHLQLIYGIGLLVVAAVFIVGRYFITIKKLNEFLEEEKTRVVVKASKEEKAKEVKKAPSKKTTSKATTKKTTTKKTK